MKRDMDLVRDILLKAEAAERPLQVESFYALNDSKELVNYHLELLIEHGFLDGALHGSWGSRVVSGTIHCLTWDGQDFLEGMRDQRVWETVKKAIYETVDSTTFDVIKSACSMVSTSMIKSHLGI